MTRVKIGSAEELMADMSEEEKKAFEFTQKLGLFITREFAKLPNQINGLEGILSVLSTVVAIGCKNKEKAVELADHLSELLKMGVTEIWDSKEELFTECEDVDEDGEDIREDYVAGIGRNDGIAKGTEFGYF